MPRIVIVGGGLSGLATAHYLKSGFAAVGRAAELHVLESNAVPGGKMRTIRQDGWNLEWGPNGFLTNKPHGMQLVHELGITDRLVRSSDLARKRFVYTGGRLHRLPESPPAFLRSRLMTLGGKLRLLGEPFARRAPTGVDESLGDFARRRLGREALAKLIDPMVTGIFAGDPDTMSLRASFPRIHELEARHGGLFRGMLALSREKRRNGETQAMSAGPGGVLMSFDHGVGVLAEALAARAGDALQMNVTVDRIERARDGATWALSLRRGGERSQLAADAVVLATPAYAASSILAPLDGTLAEALAAIPYSPVTVAALGFDRATLENPLDGFGFLVPGGEHRKILGALWDSSVFPHRAPEGRALVRVMVGGVRAPALALLPEPELLRTVRAELSDIMGIAVEPILARAFVHDRAIPQYLVGHPARLEQIEARLRLLPGLYLNSNAYRGIALNDCVLQSQRCAARLLEELP